MRATRDQLPILFGDDAWPASAAPMGRPARDDRLVARRRRRHAVIPRGCPNDRCSCPHWGYVLKGRMRVLYADGEETLQAGDLFYIPPGHTPVVEEDIEFVEISPPAESEAVLEANVNAAAAAAT